MNEAKSSSLPFQPRKAQVLTCDRQVSRLCFSPSGKVLFAAGLDGRVRRWIVDGEAPRELAPLTGHHGWVHGLALAGTPPVLLTGDSWGELRAWSPEELEPRLLWSVEQAHDGWIRSIAGGPPGATGPSGSLAATCGRDGRVRLWSAADGRPHGVLEAGEDLFAAAFHPDGRFLLAGGLSGAVHQWDIASSRLARTLDARILYKLDGIQEVGGARTLAFLDGGSLLACGGTRPKSGGFVEGTPTLRLFDWSSGAVLHDHVFGEASDGFVTDLAPHPAGFLCLTTSGQPGAGKLLFLRAGDREPFHAQTGMPNCHALALRPGGRLLAVASTNGSSNGHGRVLDKEGRYAGNYSPLHLLELPDPPEPPRGPRWRHY